MRWAATTPQMARIEPTERSMHAMEITKVIANAIIMRNIDCRVTIRILPTLKNCGEAMERAVQMTIKAIKIPPPLLKSN
jgi:hypothetical protein